MDFNILLAELRILNLPTDQFAVTSSGSMAVRGIREAHDLDIICTSHLFRELAKTHRVEKLGTGAKIKLTPNIEAVGLFTDKPDPEEQIENADVINGVRYVTLSTVRYFKARDRREKDLKDIALIDDYTKK